MRVGVVGAGITGLALAHGLVERGVETVVLEATDRPGGVIESREVEGRLLEYGPQRTRLTDGVAALVEDLGLEEELVEGDPTLPMYVYADGGLGEVPFSVRAFLRTDLLSWRGKLRLLAEPLTAAGREDETAAELFSRKFGREAYENVIGPLFGGIYGSDPAEMPAGYAPSPLLALERKSGSLLRPALERAFDNERTLPVTFEDGLARLPAALADRHAEAVDLGRPVEGIVDGDRFSLETPAGRELVDRLVLTVPAGPAADLLADLAPSAADRLRRLNYNPLGVVHLAADLDREGYGYQVRRDEDLRTLGVSWNASLFDRGDVYTAWLGGMDDPEILEADDDEIGRIAAREFAEVVDAEPAVVDVTRLRPGFPAWDTSWRALEELTVPDGVYLATNYTDRMGIPGRVRQAESLAERFAAEAAPEPPADPA